MATIKPTHKDPITSHGQRFDKDYKKTVIKTAPEMLAKLTEVDNMLNEKEQSLKKKIFSLPKMEALVFSDPMLSAEYDKMAENGEEKYGYHHNETIMNMLFNDYVLNSPKYLQKYKMAIPKEKKRRDKSGINQLKKAGAKKMDATGTKLEKSKEVDETTSAGSAGGAAGYVGYAGPAAFSSKGDLSGDMKKKKSPKAKPISTGFALGETNYLVDSSGFEKYFEMLNEDMIFEASLTTGGVGAFESPIGFKDDIKNISKQIDTEKEKKDLAEIGVAEPGKEKRAYGKSGVGVKSKDNSSAKEIPEPNKEIKKPFYKGGKIAKNPNNNLNEEFESKAQQRYFYAKANDKSLPKSERDKWKKWSKEYSDETDFNEIPEKVNEMLSLHDAVEYVSDRQGENPFEMHGNKWQFVNARYPDGKVDIGVYRFGQDIVYDYQRWQEEMGINENINEDMNDLIEFDVPTWAVSALINADESGLSDEDQFKLNNFVQDVANRYGNANFMLGDVDGKDDLGFQHSNDIDNLGSDVYRLYINPTKNTNDEDMLQETHLKTREDKVKFIKQNHPDGADMDCAKKSDEEVDKLYASTENKMEKKGKDPEKVDVQEAEMDENPVAAAALGSAAHGAGQAIGNRVADKVGLEEESMLQSNDQTIANKPAPVGDLGNGVPMGTQQTGGMNEADTKLLEEINRELNAFATHHAKLKDIAEAKKTPSMVIGDRLRSENPKNFKKDIQHSGTKDVIDVEKELQWKDQQSEVNDPQKLGQDIEKKAIKSADMKSGEALKNVGNSANRKGDEVPKRNLTSKEQEEVDLYRLGQHSLDYDNEPSERFVERMKADQGEMFDMGEKQKEFQADAPQYNKEPQPVQDTEVDKVQFDKDVKKKGDRVAWNERMGLGSNVKLNETMITGRYRDVLNKSRLIEFKLIEVEDVQKINEDEHMKLSFDGLGNTYHGKTVDKKVVVNEAVTSAMNRYSFYTDGKNVFALKNKIQNLNESQSKKGKPVVNEQQEKMKHLLGYDPKSYVSTKNIKL